MASDIKLGEGARSDWVTVEAAVLKTQGSDFMLDAAARRKENGGHRRALVHDEADGLTINFAGDYPGGVTVWNARLNIRYVVQGPEPELPKNATPGDLLFIQHLPRDPDGPPDPLAIESPTCSLWLCIPRNEVSAAEPAAWWQRIPLDEPVQGTA